MKLKLKRLNKLTEGLLFINDKFFSGTLEDKWRNLSTEPKVPGDTCIPAGTYRVVLDFSNRFKKVMPHILDVPHFEGIRVHAGNTHHDTEGCILLGTHSKEAEITHSRMAVEKFNAALKEALDNGEEVWLEIIDPE